MAAHTEAPELDGSPRAPRVGTAATEPVSAEVAYVGIIRADGFQVRVRRVDHLAPVDQAITLLARIWRDMFAGNTRAMYQALLAHDWVTLGIDSPSLCSPVAGSITLDEIVVPGLGVAHRRGRRRPPLTGNVDDGVSGQAGNLYLLDGVGRARLFTYGQGADGCVRLGCWHFRDLAAATALVAP